MKELSIADKNHIQYVVIKLEELLKTDTIHSLHKNENFEYVKHIILHRHAFAKVEHRTKYHGKFSNEHDVDKIVLALILGREETRRIHKILAPHHNTTVESATHDILVEKIFDWESCHYTKLNEPKTAYEYLVTAKPQYTDKMKPIMEELGLWGEENKSPLTEEHYKQMEDSIDDETIIAEVRKSLKYLKGVI